MVLCGTAGTLLSVANSPIVRVMATSGPELTRILYNLLNRPGRNRLRFQAALQSSLYDCRQHRLFV